MVVKMMIVEKEITRSTTAEFLYKSSSTSSDSKCITHVTYHFLIETLEPFCSHCVSDSRKTFEIDVCTEKKCRLVSGTPRPTTAQQHSVPADWFKPH